MVRKYDKQPFSFQFGDPSEVNWPKEVPAKLNINMKNIFSSWLYTGSKLPSRTECSYETEKYKAVFPAVFYGNQSSLATKTKSKRKHLYNIEQKRFYIDLNKLDKVSSLSSTEKESLIQVLKVLKCEDIEVEKKNLQRKQAKKKMKTTAIPKKLKTVCFKDSSAKKTTQTHPNDKRKSTLKEKKTIKHAGNTSKYKDCEICSKSLKEKQKTNVNQNKTCNTITFSQEQLLQTLIQLDPRSFRDTFQTPVVKPKGTSSTKIETVFRGKKKINIKNIELQYLNPTYVVQYNTNSTMEESPTNTQPGSFGVKSISLNTISNRTPKSMSKVRIPSMRRSSGTNRRLSALALNAHLGKTPTFEVVRRSRANTPRDDVFDRNSTMHDIVTPSHVIGGGSLLENIKRNQTNYSDVERENVKSCHLNPSESDIDFLSKINNEEQSSSKWPRDHMPSLILPIEQDTNVMDTEQPNKKKNQSQENCTKCVNFLKRCFCLPTEKAKRQKVGGVAKKGMTPRRVGGDKYLRTPENAPHKEETNMVHQPTDQEHAELQRNKTLSIERLKLHKKSVVKFDTTMSDQ